MPSLPYDDSLCSCSSVSGLATGDLQDDKVLSFDAVTAMDVRDVDDAVLDEACCEDLSIEAIEEPVESDLEIVDVTVEDETWSEVLLADVINWRRMQRRHSRSLLAMPTTSISEQPVGLPFAIRDLTHGWPSNRLWPQCPHLA
jgi:hypothetical protein